MERKHFRTLKIHTKDFPFKLVVSDSGITTYYDSRKIASEIFNQQWTNYIVMYRQNGSFSKTNGLYLVPDIFPTTQSHRYVNPGKH